MAVNAVRKARGEAELNPLEFRKLLRSNLEKFSLEAKFMNRYMNEGFSGGEKKKMEILQMALLEPKLAVLDETDSGLDVDALKIVAEGINRLALPSRGILLITHYQRILHYIQPHFVHVMMEGRMVKSGGPQLAQKLEREGYDWLRIQNPQLANSSTR
jgi:Fe-S cluster assembly ATP-binding protein